MYEMLCPAARSVSNTPNLDMNWFHFDAAIEEVERQLARLMLAQLASFSKM